jgi:hypothetical protein
MASVNWVLLLWARKVVLLTLLWKMMKVPIAKPLLQLLPLTVKFQDPDLLNVEAEASLVISLRESQLGLEIVHLEEWSLKDIPRPSTHSPTRSQSAMVSISPHRASLISALQLRLRSQLRRFVFDLNSAASSSISPRRSSSIYV